MSASDPKRTCLELSEMTRLPPGLLGRADEGSNNRSMSLLAHSGRLAKSAHTSAISLDADDMRSQSF
jgi:hypothetical protein